MMPFPSPPPPLGPPPPPAFAPPNSVSSAADPDNRNQLLQSIRQGKALKKTVTYDRSAPAIVGKTDGRGGGGVASRRSNGGGNGTAMMGNGSATLGRNNGLAGLFAGGMPRLKPTGLDIGQTNSTSLTSLPTSNHSSLYSKQETSRRQLSVDVKNRGPPPQPPPANQKPVMPTSSSDSVLTGHSRSSSSTSLNSALNGNALAAGRVYKAPAGGYGKPNLAPKPPTTTSNISKPSPPPKKLVSRAQSMRAPRSPPVMPPNSVPHFGGASNVSELYPIGGGGGAPPPAFHQSQDSLLQAGRNHPPHPRGGTLPNSPRAPPPPRPPLRPPLARPPPPPPSRMAMNPPHCPPPPPPPTMAPPPPPYRNHSPATSRLAPPIPCGAPPPPPVRHSSMRNGMLPSYSEIESKFLDKFHTVHEFPPPQSYLRVVKVYNSKTAKQQAPLPPSQQTHIQLSKKMWPRDNTSSC